jgi:hypothetical protein
VLKAVPHLQQHAPETVIEIQIHRGIGHASPHQELERKIENLPGVLLPNALLSVMPAHEKPVSQGQTHRGVPVLACSISGVLADRVGKLAGNGTFEAFHVVVELVWIESERFGGSSHQFSSW